MLSGRGSLKLPSLAQPGPCGVWKTGGEVRVGLGPWAPSKMTPVNLIGLPCQAAEMRRLSLSNTAPALQSSASLIRKPPAVTSQSKLPLLLSNFAPGLPITAQDRVGP